MLETPWYIYEIQDALLNPESVNWDLLERPQGEYAEACAAINARLRSIRPLLHDHLYSEAIQMAFMVPALEIGPEGNIQEWVAEHDFRQLSEWRALLQNHGRAQPPELELDISARLETCIGDDTSHKLDRLKRKHRLLPLASRPLQQRITTLRHLHKLQRENNTWIRQLDLLERARHREFPDELRAAVAAKDLEVIDQLVEQLTSSKWRIPPTPQMIAQAQKAKQTIVDTVTLRQLEEIVDQLCEGQMEGDVDKLRQAGKTYQKLLSQTKTAPPHELTTRAQGPLDWLVQQDAIDEEQQIDKLLNEARRLLSTDPAAALQVCQQTRTELKDSANLSEEVRGKLTGRIDDLQKQTEGTLEARQQFEAACNNLDTAIFRGAEPDSLKRLYNAVISFEESTPPVDLISRYRRTVADHENRKRKKLRYRQLVTVGIAALVVLAIVFATRQRRAGEQARSDEKQLKELLDDSKLPEANNLLDTLPSARRERLSHTPQAKRLQDALQEETDRQAKLKKSIVLIQSNPGDTDEADLQETENLASTQEEKDEVAKLRLKVDEAKRTRTAQEELSLTRQLADYRRLLDSLSDKNGLPLVADEQQLKGLLRELEDFKINQEDDYPTFAERADKIILEAQQLEKFAAQKHQQKTKLDKENQAQADITAAIGDGLSYKRELRAFVNDFPTSRFRKPYQTILTDINLWKGIKSVPEWKRFHDNPQKTSPNEAFKALHGTSPFDLMADDREADRKAKSARTPIDLAKTINSFLEAPLFSKLWMVKTKAGTRYYYDEELVQEKLTENNGDLEVPYRPIGTFQPGDAPQKEFVPKTEIAYCGQAPQSILVARFQEQLQQIETQDWEQTLLQIVRDVRYEKNLDPVLKLILLRTIIREASLGSHPFRQAFRPVTEAIASSEKTVIRDIDWVMPTDRTVQDARDDAVAVLEGLDDFNIFKRTFQSLRGRLQEPIDIDYQWLGRVSQEGDGRWLARWRNGKPPINGKLFVLQS
ncbi:MAG TPA: hypothetical protein EYN70_07730, partial [Planctomycetaceae bacterium]|nr:hypothetical protein [Planctomycetaceae bacterium]